MNWLLFSLIHTNVFMLTPNLCSSYSNTIDTTWPNRVLRGDIDLIKCHHCLCEMNLLLWMSCVNSNSQRLSCVLCEKMMLGCVLVSFLFGCHKALIPSRQRGWRKACLLFVARGHNTRKSFLWWWWCSSSGPGLKFHLKSLCNTPGTATFT